MVQWKDYEAERWEKLSLEERVQQVMQQSVDKKEVAGLNLLVVKDGKEMLYAQCGDRDIDGGKPFLRDTIFRMYSMSKPITSAAVMILADRGVIDLQDSVASYIPEFAGQMVSENGQRFQPARGITLRNLMNMTSGLVYPNMDSVAGRETDKLFREVDERLYTDHPMTTMEIAKALGKSDLAFAPGAHFNYGTSADVLGAVIEAATGILFGDFLKKEIWEPLGMQDTAFYVPADKQERLAKVYNSINGGIEEEKTRNLGINYAMDKRPAFESGGAGMVSTVDDYAKFARMLLNGGETDGKRILSKGAVHFMTNGKLLPWQQDDFERGWDGHTGCSYGNLMRVMERPGQSVGLASKGEYGWDGWLGPYFCNDPAHNMTILMGMQKIGGGTWSLTRKLRNLIFGAVLEK